jgi:hypothetical protein
MTSPRFRNKKSRRVAIACVAIGMIAVLLYGEHLRRAHAQFVARKSEVIANLNLRLRSGQLHGANVLRTGRLRDCLQTAKDYSEMQLCEMKNNAANLILPTSPIRPPMPPWAHAKKIY